MENFNLFDTIYEFIQTFFIGEHLTDTSIVQLMALVLTVAFIYGLIIYPILWMFGFRGKKR